MPHLVSEIEEIAPYAQLLSAVGVSTVNDLSRCDAEELVLVLETMNQVLQVVRKTPNENTVARWIAVARGQDALSKAHKSLRERTADIADIYDLAGWQGLVAKAKPPTPDEMRTTIEQVMMVIDQLYPHLGMKSARHAIDYLQSLDLLRQRVNDRMEGRYFHSEMLRLLKSFADIHTAYRLPPPYRHSVAFLPLLIQRSYRKGEPEYFATHTLWEPSPDVPLKSGDQILRWNGVPMSQAVQNNLEFVEGANFSAKVSLALQYMTMRWLGGSFPPDAPWVIVTFKDSQGAIREVRLSWRILVLKEDHGFMTQAQFLWLMMNPAGGGLPVDHALNANHQIQHISNLVIFRQDKHQAIREMSKKKAMHRSMKKLSKPGGRRRALRQVTEETDELQPGEWQHEFKGLTCRSIPSALPMFLEAWQLQHKKLRGREFGQIRIRGFPPGGPPREEFIPEFRRLLAEMPPDGLIVDIRGNPGGSANLAETILQLLCAKEIQPLTFQFVATPLTQQIASVSGSEYAKWAPSIDMALRTGAKYSSGFPITDPVAANELGQEYFGPVALLTSATSYSAADIFAAGFQDHEIGPLIGIDSTTGGGGANVWFYRPSLGDSIPNEPLRGVPKKQLPKGIDLQFAARRCLRIGKNLGIPIEEIGVETAESHRHELTRDDLIREDVDLRYHVMRVLSKLPTREFNVRVSTKGGFLGVVVESTDVDLLEILLNGRLLKSQAVDNGGDKPAVTRIRRKWSVEQNDLLEIIGYKKTRGDPVRVIRYKRRLQA